MSVRYAAGDNAPIPSAIHMSATARTILKAILSIPIAFGLAYPLVHPSEDGGVLGEIAVLGTIGSIVVIAVFPGAGLCLRERPQDDPEIGQPRIACGRTQQRLADVPLGLQLHRGLLHYFQRCEVPGSGVSYQSGSVGVALVRPDQRHRMVSCRVLSLIPNAIGSIAGGVAVFLWVWHWVFVRRTNKMLAGSRVSVATLPTDRIVALTGSQIAYP